MNHWISNIRVAVAVTLVLGVIYALSAEQFHATKHKQYRNGAELEQAMNYSPVNTMIADR